MVPHSPLSWTSTTPADAPKQSAPRVTPLIPRTASTALQEQPDPQKRMITPARSNHVTFQDAIA